MFLACVEEQGCVVSKGIGCLYSSCSTVTKKVENATFIISNYFALFLGPFFRYIFRCFQSILKNGNCILHTATCLPKLVLGLYTNWYIRENCLTYIQ